MALGTERRIRGKNDPSGDKKPSRATIKNENYYSILVQEQ